MTLLEPSQEVVAFLSKLQGVRIGGEQIETGALLDVIDPSFGTRATQVALGNADHINDAVSAARAALQGPWGSMTPCGCD